MFWCRSTEEEEKLVLLMNPIKTASVEENKDCD